MKTIVVGYDDTKQSQRALDRATELASAFGAKVIVTGVAHKLVPTGRGIGPIDPVDPPEARRAELKAVASRLAERGIESEYEVALGDPADEIVRVAEERAADLVVVGTREPGLVSRLLGQSVSGAVQRKAHCDVLVVH